MATYTDNYQLTKPTYAEQADIGVINSNMNIIDDIMHSSQVSLAPAYDQSQTYAEGDVVMYELLMYKCISPTTGVWDASKWERTTASESGGGGSAELDILGEGNGAVVSFSDGASAELAKCIAEIVPKQAGSGTPSPSNVRAISGYTAVKVNVSGKNILPTSLATMKSINTAGTWDGNKYTILGVEYTVLTDADGNITGINANGLSSGNADLSIVSSFTAPEACKMTGCPAGGGANKYQFYLSGNVGDYGNGANISSGATGRPYLRIFNGYNANNLMFYPMIRKATDSEEFEPYKGSTTTTPLGQTVYGGQLNVLTGELTIDKGMVTFDGSEQWQSMASVGYPIAYRLDGNWGAKNVSVGTENGFSNRYEYSLISLPEQGYRFANNNADTLYVYDKNFSNDLAGFKASLSSINMQMCYELATPQTVQLTPQEVNSLLGQNNISADTGDIDIVYVKASAPIQPNPTGTPTATLKKLGIEGTVFEVEGGGGGSSSGINYSTTEQKTGRKWIDGKDTYIRVFNTDTITESGQTLGNIPDIDAMINQMGCFKRLNQWYNCDGRTESPSYNNYYAKVDIASTGAVIFAFGGYNANEFQNVHVIIEYTKITD